MCGLSPISRLSGLGTAQAAAAHNRSVLLSRYSGIKCMFYRAKRTIKGNTERIRTIESFVFWLSNGVFVSLFNCICGVSSIKSMFDYINDIMIHFTLMTDDDHCIQIKV